VTNPVKSCGAGISLREIISQGKSSSSPVAHERRDTKLANKIPLGFSWFNASFLFGSGFPKTKLWEVMKFILGRKLGMTTIYNKEKGALNVTLLHCGPNLITQIRTEEKDKYNAVQIGILKSKVKSQKSKFWNDFLKIKELKGEIKDVKAGDKIDISQFEVGDKVKVSGISKGKGFQGVMKRHGFKGSPHSHGHKHDWRAPGSIGSSFPEHVIKGKKWQDGWAASGHP